MAFRINQKTKSPNKRRDRTGYRLSVRRNVQPDMMRTSLILIAIVLLAGCSTSVRTEFATLDEAKQADAFARGWLPPLLPEGSTEICEFNNLDHNTGTGTFRFPQEATSEYLHNIVELHGGIVTKTPLGITVMVTDATTQWHIKLDLPKSH